MTVVMIESLARTVMPGSSEHPPRNRSNKYGWNANGGQETLITVGGSRHEG